MAGEASAASAAHAGAVRLLRVLLAAEPSIEDVQRAAERRAGPGREDAHGLRRRSRLAALVPRLVADYRHDERSYRVVGVTSSAEVDYLRENPGNAVSVRLELDLSGLVLGRRELEAVSAGQRLERDRRAAADRATRLYHERLRLRLALLVSPPGDAAERAGRELGLEEVTAELDALTGLYGRSAP